MKKIETETLNILKQGRFENGIYFLPTVQLDRKQYVKVNEVLENAGGKWSRKDKGHIFQSDPRKLWTALETGETVNEKKLYQFFETPPEVAKKMIELANIKTGMSVLEPSAGHGAILDYLPKDIELYIIEIDREKCDVLEGKGYVPVYCIDFLSLKGGIGGFDRIIMNPPFTKGQDADHVLKAYECLNEIGTLVSVMSASVTFNQQKKYQKVRELIEKNGKIIELPVNSFKKSGTKVNTVLVIINRFNNSPSK